MGAITASILVAVNSKFESIAPTTRVKIFSW
jgi:hypothetical protein